MAKKVSKEMIWMVYAILIVMLGIISYFIGKKNKKGKLYASIGVLLGVVISVILWMSVGKKMVESGY